VRIKSIKNLKNLKNKTVLVRADFDVPIKQETRNKKQETKILDDTRLKALLPTIKFLLNKKVKKIILIGHLGRPNGRVVNNLSLEPIKNYLEKLLKLKINFFCHPEFISGLNNILKQVQDDKRQVQDDKRQVQDDKRQVQDDKRQVQDDRKTSNVIPSSFRDQDDNKIVMLENIRFFKEEKKNNKKFAKKLASLADIYINECFSTSHRKHASIDAIQDFLPSYAGLNLEQEIKNLFSAINKPKKPLVLIIGGAKIETKLPIINNLINKADYILVGGAVANNFFKAKGFEIGKSFVDKEYIKEAKGILNFQDTRNNFQINSKIQNSKKSSLLITDYTLFLPIDVITQDGKIKSLNEIKSTDKILDIGPKTIILFSGIIKSARTIVWNGPMGYFEDKNFKNGTDKIAENIFKNKKAKIIIGGGETGQVIKKLNKNNNKKNIFISTGGGAMLKFMAGEKLPGLKKIYKK